MAETVAQPAPPYVDDIGVKPIFADACAGINFSNGNFHFTFVSLTADHSSSPPPTRRIVSARVVVPTSGAIELRDMLTQFIHMLTAQGVLPHAPHEPILSVPAAPEAIEGAC